MRQLSFFLVATALLFSSCGKDKTKTELLTGSWKFTNAVSGSTNVFATIPACSKDDVFTFLANGTVTTDEGPSKCNAGDPQTTSGPWRWAANETELILGNDTMKSLSLTEKTLVGTLYVFNTTPLTITFTKL
jgi:hypothetical protein